MRKTSAVLLAALIIMSALFLTPVSAADDFPYARITASGNDPHGTFNFSPDGKNDSIDPDTVKWASIKYRTITETDSTGVQLIGQFYIVPAMEPFVPMYAREQVGISQAQLAAIVPMAPLRRRIVMLVWLSNLGTEAMVPV